jgi:YD repeat-containing protein
MAYVEDRAVPQATKLGAEGARPLTQIGEKYDGVGNKTKEIDPELKEKTYTYDSDNRVLTATVAQTNTTRFVYNPDGQLWKQIDPENKTTTYEYDTDGRLVKTTDGNGNEIVNEYDGTTCGTSCSGTDLPSKTIFPTFSRTYTYDTRGRKKEERDILSETESYVTKYSYDGVGNVTSITDKENKVTTSVYDELNRKVKVIDPLTNSTEFKFDNRDNLLSLKDAKGQTTLFEYDRNSRLTKETRPMGQATTYTYDGAGNLTRKVDPKNQKIEYGYDDAGRLGTVKYFSVSSDTSPVKTVGFTFDKAGNLKTYNDGATSGSYTYDDAYRKLSETINYGSFSLGYSYTYYKNGQKKSFTDPSGVTYEYGYDTNNQLSTLSVPNIGVTTYNRYTWTMPATITLPGGTRKENTYTPLMQPKTIEVKDVSQNSLMAYSYAYSASGNITSRTWELRVSVRSTLPAHKCR